MTVDTREQQIYALQEEIPCTADIGSTEGEQEISHQDTRSLFAQMPASGTGFIFFYFLHSPTHKRYGRPEVIRAIQHIGQEAHGFTYIADIPFTNSSVVFLSVAVVSDRLS